MACARPSAIGSGADFARPRTVTGWPPGSRAPGVPVATLRPRSVEFKADIANKIYDRVWPLFAAGTMKVVMDSTYPLTEAASAHARLDEDHIGKIVLETGL